jgi:hypothetical protein
MNFIFSIFITSPIVGQNITKPTWAHPYTSRGLSTNTKSLARGTVVGRFGSGKKKKRQQPS